MCYNINCKLTKKLLFEGGIFMKNRDYKQAQLKHQLFQMRNAKKKNPRWKLDPEQVEYIRNIGFSVEAYLYRIKTKPIYDVKHQSGILKTIHYSFVQDHKRYIYKTLSKKEKAILLDKGIEFKPYKYEVYLNQYVGK